MRALGLLLTVACACATPETRIVGQCAVESEPVRLLGAPRALGLGVIDELTLLLWWEPRGEDDADVFAQWFDRDFDPVGDQVYVGSSRILTESRFVRDGECLRAQIWADPSGDDPTRILPDMVRLWRFCPRQAPQAVAELSGVSREAYCSDCPANNVSLSSAFLPAPYANAPTVEVDGRFVGVLAGIPELCGGDLANFHRLTLLDEVGGHPVLWGGDNECDLARTQELMVTSVNAIGLDGDRIGVFVRLGEAIGHGHVHYLVLDADYQIIWGPRRVGRTGTNSISDGGYQPHVAAVGGGRVIFNERVESHANTCQSMRTLRDDGSDVEVAPWQLPCIAQPDRFLSRSSGIVTGPGGHGVIAWAERNSFGLRSDTQSAWTTRITLETEWDEGIHLALLTPEGQRGSEVLRVTDDAATTLTREREVDDGPFPGDFLVYLAADEENVVVGWNDTRPEAPGFYVRRVRCTSME